MPCAYKLTRPTGYTMRYVCECGWVSDEVDSDNLATIGAQLVRHGKETRTT